MRNTYTQPVIQHYTVRANRGKPRIWLEGKRLAAAGFNAGDRFEIITTRTVGALLILRKVDGERRISGTESRPIIDLSGSSCYPFATGDAVSVEYSTGQIIIRGEG